MIEFKSLYQETPYLILKKKYDEAIDAGQNNIEAIAISSYDQKRSEVDSRFVNLKFIDKKNFIFFSNYDSPKSIAFANHKQISALLYWQSTNVQIRMRAIIHKTSMEFNQEYFKKRSTDKNALAISSDQSQEIKSYSDIVTKYEHTKSAKDLLKCPNYWGGFAFTPYYFEFWEGHESRLNKRDVYEISEGNWSHSILQP